MKGPWNDWTYYAHVKTGTNLFFGENDPGYSNDILVYNSHVMVYDYDSKGYVAVWHGDINKRRWAELFGWSILNSVPIILCYEDGRIFGGTFMTRHSVIDRIKPFGNYCDNV